MTADQRAALADQFEKASRIAGAEPVAVVGIGCRFPGDVVGPEGYWALLTTAGMRSARSLRIAGTRDAFYDPDPLAPGRMPSKWGGFLSDVAGFDADFFGISPREAEAMDPQQRVLLEVAWEALEHAGIAPDHLGGTRTAVMMGVYYGEYQSASATNPDEYRRLFRDRQRAQRHGRADRVPVGAAWSGGGGGYRLLVVVGISASGLSKSADAGERPGPRRRGQSHPAPGNPARTCEVGHAVSARPVSCLRCGGGRFRAR